ncbi:MAG TPA: exodeoxyribonuclease VII large subunit [Syntrophales bacterium]|nr:exodeoxyribonuclease VII large subunit [Syntrophales bacterium]HPX10644.1 exodeoxyribonuclease VII large subunit [Syntrophales bacterium]HQB29985.1 exodeoxyribonuclease VII large subunit [Syntrophales bacterium]HQN78805.1 exodeoxyribonuclease VII large subunit [Syntrophales bacterium]
MIDPLEETRVLTVTELTGQIREVLEGTFGFLWVKGEVSNLRRPSSGHLYFTLKDDSAQIRAVLFRQSAGRLGFDLEDGMEILCRGKITVYGQRGEYQILVDAAEPRGLGALQKAFEQLKKRLEEEGLFDRARKKPLPFLPERIAVVTSPTGAVIRDILNITGRRFPSVDILVVPVRVQGAEAAPEICEAIALLNEHSLADVMIVARGGGSLEDLLPFNDERVARAIHASRIPVISAVGHEIDFTIADFVADLRAPTPSAAAELVVPGRDDLMKHLVRNRERLAEGIRTKVKPLRDRLEFLQGLVRSPARRIDESRIGLDRLLEEMEKEMRGTLESKTERADRERERLMAASPRGRVREVLFQLDSVGKNMVAGLQSSLRDRTSLLRKCGASLDALSPLSVLRRGYGIVRKWPEGRIVRDASTLAAGDRVSARLNAGTFLAGVISTSPEGEGPWKE